MSHEAHKRVASLGEKLAFSNALLKEARHDLAALRTEHGKTTAWAQELEAKLKKHEARAASYRGTAKRLTASLRACREANDVLRMKLNSTK